MDQILRTKIQGFFKDSFAETIHQKITAGYKLKKFNLNPIVVTALASGVFGKISSENIAKSLIYPRVLGTSINTNFGDKMQTLCTNFLGATGSGTSGMDIEFFDKKDNIKVIMQLKAGPNTINAGDVQQIIDEMRAASRLLIQNRSAEKTVFALGITYGQFNEISSHYKKIHEESIGIQLHIPIYIGKELWWRITGEENFYSELIAIAAEVFETEDYSSVLSKSISDLAREIDNHYFLDGHFDMTKFSR